MLQMDREMAEHKEAMQQLREEFEVLEKEEKMIQTDIEDSEKNLRRNIGIIKNPIPCEVGPPDIY